MKRPFLILLLSFSFLNLHAQYAVDNDKSSLSLDGTSNVHDWTENAETINGKMVLAQEAKAITNISQLSLTIPVKGLKSGKSSMDKNTYKALQADDHPNIVFNLKSAEINGPNIKFIGSLNVAGSSKDVTVKSTYTLSGNTIVIAGKYACKMTDFGIEPPTALLGTMKTGDDIVINFNLAFNKN